MKRILLLTFALGSLAISAAAQTFTTSATITISRKSDGANPTQNKADRALMEDIERYVIGVNGAIVNPTEKGQDGLCLPFRTTIGSKTINVDVYNRDASTCAPVIQANGKRDLRTLNALTNIIQRVIVTQFNFLTDAGFVTETVNVAALAATAVSVNDPVRAAEKVDPPL